MTGMDTTPEPDTNGRTTVLEVFGMKLSVKNRRLAEILTMDAAEALGLDKRPGSSMHGSAVEPVAPDLMAQAVPDVLLAVPDADDEAEARLRTEARRQLDEVAVDLGFEVLSGGSWGLPGDAVLHTRVISRTLTAAAAIDTVAKLADVVLSGRERTDSVLLLTLERASVEPLLNAIASRGLHGSFRVAHIDDVNRLRDLCRTCADRADAASGLLSPAASVDLARMLALLESLGEEESRGRTRS
jgi:hypothetical protein